MVLYSVLSPLQELVDGESLVKEDRLGCSGKMESDSFVHSEEVSSMHLINNGENQENKQYCCLFCQHKTTRLALAKHLQEKHCDNILTCEKCSLRFVECERFEAHQVTHTSGSHVCDNCGVKFASIRELYNHSTSEHTITESEENKCPICNKIFAIRSKFVSHVIKLHRGKVEIDGLVWGSRGLLVCELCQKIFKKASLYVAHEKTHRGKAFTCLYCENTYLKQNLFQDHILTHLFGDYTCSDCKAKFSSSYKLGLHEEKVHSLAPSKTCEYCDKKFPDQMKLICHRRKDHPESQESQKAKYCCSQCGMKFVMRGNLIRHLRVHEKDRDAQPPCCTVCGKTLANKYSLATHMRTHSKETTNKCDICDKTFVSKYTLIDHVRRIHEEFGPGRDKVCGQCGRSFFTKTELNYHVKSHTGERPYRCDVCGETYLSSSTLRYHMQKHSNIMFVCPQCKAKFENYVGWSTHMKRVHGVSRMKEYTKQHGILQVVMNKETPLYIYSDGHNGGIDNSLSNLVQKSDDDNAQSLAVGLEETIVSVPGSDAIQVVSYADVANPLVHTVSATETELGHSGSVESDITNRNLPSDTGLGRSHIDPMSDDEWEIILPNGREDPSVMPEEWVGPRMAVCQGAAQQFVLTGEWEGSQLIVAEDGEEARVEMAAWKGVEY